MGNRLHIRVDIEYDLHGETIEAMREMAERAVHALFGQGAFTDTTTAEISKWTCTVGHPRDKHVAIVSDGYTPTVFGIFDGREKAEKACVGLDAVIVRLNEVTSRMRDNMWRE